MCWPIELEMKGNGEGRRGRGIISGTLAGLFKRCKFPRERMKRIKRRRMTNVYSVLRLVPLVERGKRFDLCVPKEAINWDGLPEMLLERESKPLIFLLRFILFLYRSVYRLEKTPTLILSFTPLHSSLLYSEPPRSGTGEASGKLESCPPGISLSLSLFRSCLLLLLLLTGGQVRFFYLEIMGGPESLPVCVCVHVCGKSPSGQVCGS